VDGTRLLTVSLRERRVMLTAYERDMKPLLGSRLHHFDRIRPAICPILIRNGERRLVITTHQVRLLKLLMSVLLGIVLVTRIRTGDEDAAVWSEDRFRVVVWRCWSRLVRACIGHDHLKCICWCLSDKLICHDILEVKSSILAPPICHWI
jgi:hypothetical protein